MAALVCTCQLVSRHITKDTKAIGKCKIMMLWAALKAVIIIKQRIKKATSTV